MKRRIPLEQAVQELKKIFDDITNVNEWARHMGYSRSYFSRKVKILFGKTPKEILRECQMGKIETEILEDPEAIGYKIAANTGLNSPKRLQEFLSNHYDMTLNDLRQKIL